MLKGGRIGEECWVANGRAVVVAGVVRMGWRRFCRRRIEDVGEIYRSRGTWRAAAHSGFCKEFMVKVVCGKAIAFVIVCYEALLSREERNVVFGRRRQRFKAARV